MSRQALKWESLIGLYFFVLLQVSAAGPSTLYDGSLHTSPAEQGWLYLTQPLIGASAITSVTNEAIRLDSTGDITDKAGFFSTLPPFGVHPALPVLDRTNGLVLTFKLSVLKEMHTSERRSGFSVIVLCSDLKGVELEFWENEIWAQTDQPLFTHGEGKMLNATNGPVSYALTVHGDHYQLTANGMRILEGPLRDYSLSGQPYTIPNFIFLGDNTGSAAAAIELSFVSVELPADPVVETLIENGPGSNRLNIIFLAEGYTSAQQTQFQDDAKRLMANLLETRPFKGYNSYFNGYSLFVASKDSGSDHPSQGLFRDTYFNSSYEVEKNINKIGIPPDDWNSNYAEGQGKIDVLLASGLVPRQNQISILLVNDPEYGGSGGVVAIASLHELSADLVLHELGHSLAVLGEEYGGPWIDNPSAEAANTTRETRRDHIKWRRWIEDATPVPTSAAPEYADKIGLFEGAQASDTGWYRPALNCKMRSLEAPFCDVCAEAFVESFYARVSLIEKATPEPSLLTATSGQMLSFEVETLRPEPDSIRMQWFLNESVIPGATNHWLKLPAETLLVGTNHVAVTARDETALVRDPDAFLEFSHQWKVIAGSMAPFLSIRQDGADVILTWPLSASTAALEMAEQVNGPWHPVTAGILKGQESYKVRLPKLSGASFYRLISSSL